MKPNRTIAGREAAEGLASAALSMTLFGVIWATGGASALGGAAGTVLLAVSWALVAVLCLCSVRLRRAARVACPATIRRELGRGRSIFPAGSTWCSLCRALPWLSRASCS